MEALNMNTLSALAIDWRFDVPCSTNFDDYLSGKNCDASADVAAAEVRGSTKSH